MQESAVTSETRAGGPSWPLVARERPPPAAHRREDAWNTHGRRRVVGGWWDWERSSKIPESAECCCSIRSHSPAIPLWEPVGSPFHARRHHLITLPMFPPKHGVQYAQRGQYAPRRHLGDTAVVPQSPGNLATGWRHAAGRTPGGESPSHPPLVVLNQHASRSCRVGNVKRY